MQLPLPGSEPAEAFGGGGGHLRVILRGRWLEGEDRRGNEDGERRARW